MKAKLTLFFSLPLLFLFGSCLSHNARTINSEGSPSGIVLNEEDIVGDYLDNGIFNRKIEAKGELFYQEESYRLDYPLMVGKKSSIYTTKGHETLMLIAFEVYSNYNLWKRIYRANQKLLEGIDEIPAGLELQILHPLNIYEPSKGRPYLIKWGDTLSLISKKVYGLPKFWPEIYENNIDQMPNPNKIFAGFTLFYPTEPLKKSSRILPH